MANGPSPLLPDPDALQASEGRFRALIEQSPVAIAVARDGITRYVNRAFQDLFSLVDPSGLVGASILAFIAPEGRDVIQARITRRAQGLPVAPLVDTVGLRMDGAAFPMQMAVAVVQVPEGAETVFFLTDLTERLEAEAQRAALQSQLLQMQKMESLGSLAGGVAHDMNNVLAAILALASTHLTVEAVDSPAYRAFKTIGEAALRGADLVKGLLHFARQSPSLLQSVDLNAVVEQGARLLERTTLARVRVVMDLAPDLRPIRGDASALSHALMNLCVNAVDAMAEGGTLSLATRNLGEALVELVVGDTGTGMTEEVLAKATDPFFTTKEVGKGTGLGLAMVFNTVRAHQGVLRIVSAPDQGTRVKLRFPAADPEASPPRQAPAPAGPPARPLAVLLVDDDELVRRSTGMLVEVLGHKVTSASSGEEALALLEGGAEADVAVLDMNMPGLGGKGTLPRLLALRPGLRVFLATGRADQEALDLVAAHPEAILLPKPFSIEQLQNLLADLGQGGS